MGAVRGKNMAERELSVAILAAGKGTRMRSQLPKVLHKLGSLSLIERLLRTVLTLKPHRCLVIVGYEQEQVRQALREYPVEFVEQAQQLGTGHAIQQLLPVLGDFQGDLLVRLLYNFFYIADIPIGRSLSFLAGSLATLGLLLISLLPFLGTGLA